MSLLKSVFNENETQDLASTMEKREQYGEIFTPYVVQHIYAPRMVRNLICQ